MTFSRPNPYMSGRDDGLRGTGGNDLVVLHLWDEHAAWALAGGDRAPHVRRTVVQADERTCSECRRQGTVSPWSSLGELLLDGMTYGTQVLGVPGWEETPVRLLV